ncbi:MAG: LexA family transcriptional regulator [Candidatus Pacebacteria bacterium]|jgi:SOS-response transcriptional repressor LexA|nr:LexA family transcriptional regulator [Candidatus Paceibacterota bacterium]
MSQSPHIRILEFYETHRRMPTYSEMAILCNLKSKSSAYEMASRLIREGVLAKDKKTGTLVPRKNYRELPFVGLVQAGFPSPTEDVLSDTMSLDDYLVEHRERTYLMRATGDSMINAGIHSGDMLIVERRSDAPLGAIVIALVDNERTMKYLRKDKKTGAYYLEAANEKYPDIYPEGALEIEAVVRGVVRKY